MNIQCKHDILLHERQIIKEILLGSTTLLIPFAERQLIKMKETVRNSNHELLRIIAMYMIIFIHANMYLGNFCTGSIRTFFNGFVNGICNIGVSCFILISGYYGIKFSFQKFVKMECMMITFSILETIILCIALPQQMQGAALLEQIVKTFFPFITRKYWFYSSYICLFFFSGYIQKFIEVLDKKEFKKLLFTLLLLFSILPTLFYFELIPDNGKGLVQMIMIYMIGRYIKMYCDSSVWNYSNKKCFFALFIILWVVNGVSHEFPIQIGGIYHHLCKDNSITNLTMAIILFFIFKELTIKSKFINKIAAYIFAAFALENSLVIVTMQVIGNMNLKSLGGIGGFLTLSFILFGILAICLLLGLFREAIFKKIDLKASRTAKHLLDKASCLFT